MAFATAAAAQAAAPQAETAPPSSASTLNLPQTVQLFGSAMPSVVKATAIVNGEVITQTDVDQRLALLAMSQEAPIQADQIDQLRQQVLRNLIDETLQIQAAKRDRKSVLFYASHYPLIVDALITHLRSTVRAPQPA
jgi:peptidyl-prolyl cis-trans isomerase SurA